MRLRNPTPACVSARRHVACALLPSIGEPPDCHSMDRNDDGHQPRTCSSSSPDTQFQGAIVRPMFLGTILRQQQPCRDDPVGTFQPERSRTRVVLIRGSRARASALGRETTSLDDIAWFERILAETIFFKPVSRPGAFEGPANRLSV